MASLAKGAMPAAVASAGPVVRPSTSPAGGAPEKKVKVSCLLVYVFTCLHVYLFTRFRSCSLDLVFETRCTLTCPYSRNALYVR